MSRDELWAPIPANPFKARFLAGALHAAGLALLFGLRLWAAVCLAFYVAFRLAQRVPVRIKIDQVPDGVRLVQGMTATVELHHREKL